MFALFALVALVGSGQVFAQSCDFVSYTGAQSAEPGGTVSFTLRAETACSANVDISLSIAPGETTGGAAVVPPTNPTLALDIFYTFDVALGGVAGGSGTVIATCLNGGCAGDTLTFPFATTDVQFTANPPTTIVVAEGDAFTIGTHVEVDGVPNTQIQTSFSNVTTGFNYGTVTPDGSGDATSPSISINTDGAYVLRGTPVCPTAVPIPGCSALTPVDFAVTVEATSLTAVPPTTLTIAAGDTATLTAYLGSTNVPEPDGSTLIWSVPTQPAGGDGTVVGSPVAGGAGESTADFTATIAGVYTVTAFTTVTQFTPNTATFNVTVTAVPTLDLEQGDGQVSAVGVPFTDTLMVLADDSGTPPVGLTIDWTLVSGNATFPATSTTDAGGNAEISVTPTAAGPIQIVASRSDAPGATVTFNLTATAGTPTITAVSADPAPGTVGASQVFTVLVESGGIPVNGGPVTWSANAPFAPATANSATDPSGEASASFTPSAAGTFTNVVTATYDQDGVPASGDEVSYSFDASVVATPTLAIDAGNGQNVDEGTPYPIDLSVLAENSGAPAGGVGIDWVVTGGTATIVDNGPTDSVTGLASATVTPTSSGAITITATRQDAPTASVTFNLTANAVAYTLVPTTPVNTTVGVATGFEAVLELNGVPVNGATIDWTAAAPFTPAGTTSTTDAGGSATASFTPSAAGTFANVVTAQFDPDGIPANGDEVTATFTAVVAAVTTLTLVDGDGQTADVGTPFAVPLEVVADDSGVAAVGVGILWTVDSGSATIVDSGATDGLGHATATVTPTGAGPIVVTAARADDPTATVTFNLTATALVYGLTAVTPNPADGTIGTPLAFTVALDQAGAPVAGRTVVFTAGPSFAPSSQSDGTDAAGEATATFTPSAAGSFPNAVVASFDPDGVPASGDEISLTLGADIAAVPTLAITAGNGQSGQVGSPGTELEFAL